MILLISCAYISVHREKEAKFASSVEHKQNDTPSDDALYQKIINAKVFFVLLTTVIFEIVRW